MKTGEVKRELDALSADIKRQFAEVGERFAEVDARFAEVDARFAQVDARFARFDRVEQRISDESERTRQYVDQSEATTRRHFDVIAESLRTEMRQGFAAIAAMEARFSRHDGEQATLTHILDDHELRLKALERKPRSR